MLSQALTEAAGHARMWKMWLVSPSKCMVFFVSVLSHALVMPYFKQGKLLHAHYWLKQIACKTNELFTFFLLHSNPMWKHRSLLSGSWFVMCMVEVFLHTRYSSSTSIFYVSFLCEPRFTYSVTSIIYTSTMRIPLSIQTLCLRPRINACINKWPWLSGLSVIQMLLPGPI